MVFSSVAIVAVTDVSTNSCQRMMRVPSSEMLNTQQLLEMAYCIPYSHIVRCLWEFLCLPIPDSYDTLSSSDDDDDASDSNACF